METQFLPDFLNISSWGSVFPTDKLMTRVGLMSKPGQKKLCLHHSSLTQTESIVRQSSKTSLRLLMCAQACAETAVVCLRKCQRPDRGVIKKKKKKHVRHWLDPWIAIPNGVDNENAALIAFQGRKGGAQKNTYHHCHTFHGEPNVSHPVFALGSCPNKETL